jgi:hypothetical protein
VQQLYAVTASVRRVFTALTCKQYIIQWSSLSNLDVFTCRQALDHCILYTNFFMGHMQVATAILPSDANNDRVIAASANMFIVARSLALNGSECPRSLWNSINCQSYIMFLTGVSRDLPVKLQQVRPYGA